MRELLEAVPNFSVGAIPASLDAIREAIEAHARVLDVHADADHNRSVFTCVGRADELVEGLAAGIAVAAERIDLAMHEGVHPRVGAADVVPFVRFRAGDAEPGRVARPLGERIGALGIPVLGYARPRRSAAARRSSAPGGTDGWPPGSPPATSSRSSARRSSIRPRAPCCSASARRWSRSTSSSTRTTSRWPARSPRRSRERDGGLPGVQALGLRLAGTGRAQVSMNLIDVAATPLHGWSPRSSGWPPSAASVWRGGELVGLMPASVAAAAAGAALQICPGMAPDRVLEVAAGGRVRRRDAAALRGARGGDDPAHRARPDRRRRRGRRPRAARAVELARGRARQIAASRALIDRVVADGTPTYGVNTGFGRFVDVHIAPEQAAAAPAEPRCAATPAASATPFPDEVVRAAMLLRANALAKGTSGVRREPVQLLLDLLAAGMPPSCRRAGRSARAAIWRPSRISASSSSARGRRAIGGETLPGGEALARPGSSRSSSAAKEGLALINGTQFMAAIGALVAVPRAPAREAGRPRRRADARGACAGRGRRSPPSCRRCGRIPARSPRRRTCTGCSTTPQIVASHRWCGRVQDAYSLRCAPQVHGAVRDAVAYAERRRSPIELNAATDNPLVLAERGEVLSNGNFHGEPVAIALDTLKIGAGGAGVDLRAADRADAEPDHVERPAAVPDRGRRPQLRAS